MSDEPLTRPDRPRSTIPPPPLVEETAGETTIADAANVQTEEHARSDATWVRRIQKAWLQASIWALGIVIGYGAIKLFEHLVWKK